MSDALEAATADAPVAPQSAFDLWLDAARPKAALWRVVIGCLVIVTVWAVWSFLVILATLFVWMIAGGDNAPTQSEMIDSIMRAETPVLTMAIMLTFLGLWAGVWLALVVLHGKQSLSSLFSPEGRVRWKEFRTGLAIIAVYLAINLALSLAAGSIPYRSNLPVAEWAMIAAPIALLVYLQSTGEELAFRGYLVQQIGARFRSPIIWGVLPAFLFGMGHFTDIPSVEFGLYYVTATTLFGLTAASVVWRTGGLSVAMGMHVGNNLLAFLVVGTDDWMAATQLWLWPAEVMTRVSVIDLSGGVLLLAYVLSPWAPFPRETALFGKRRKEMRAAP